MSLITITTMNSKDVIKKLESEISYLVRVKGAHQPYKHPLRPGLVAVKHPDADSPKGTLASIERQAGWR